MNTINKFLQKRESGKKLQRKLTGFIILFLISNFLFFTSNFWLSEGYENYPAAKVSDSVSNANRIFTVALLLYDKQTSDLYIGIEIENLSLENENTYKYIFKDKDSVRKVNILKENDKIALLKVESVKRDFKEISLEISSKKESFSPVKIYTNKKQITHKNEINPDELTRNLEEEIRLAKKESYRMQMYNLTQENKDDEKKLSKAEDKLLELETELNTSKDAESMEVTNAKIANIQSLKKDLTSNIFDRKQKIESLNEKIKALGKEK